MKVAAILDHHTLGNPYVGITVNVRCYTFFLFTLFLAI